MFPSHRRPGEPLDRHEARKPWEKLTKAAGLEGVGPHTLRHSLATQAASSGGTLHRIGRLLGHSSTSVTERYAHHVEREVQDLATEAAEAVEAALAGKVLEVHPAKAKGKASSKRSRKAAGT